MQCSFQEDDEEEDTPEASKGKTLNMFKDLKCTVKCVEKLAFSATTVTKPIQNRFFSLAAKMLPLQIWFRHWRQDRWRRSGGSIFWRVLFSWATSSLTELKLPEENGLLRAKLKESCWRDVLNDEWVGKEQSFAANSVKSWTKSFAALYTLIRI